VRSLAVLAVLAACGDSAQEPLGPAPDPDPPGEAALARLTAVQYDNTVRDLFGDELVVPTKLEPDTSIDGLIAIGASQTSISPRGVEQYETASLDIAGQVMDEGPMRDRLVTCTPAAAADDGCAREVLADLGLRAWRRPLTAAELDTLANIATSSATTLGDFYDGLELAVGAILQSPYFLYRIELGEPDPANPNRLRYTDYEMASRLSYFLWNTTPDAELLAAAASGELTTDDGLRAHADRLLASPRARAALRNLFTDMFELYRLDDLVKDPTVFTHMSDEVGPSAREETLRLIDFIVFEQDGDYRDLFTTRRTFVNRKLASIYNVRAPDRDGFGELTWDTDAPRRGLLTHMSILALHSHPIHSSATLRGKFVRKVLLCGRIPPPPTDVNTAIPEPSPELPTLRDRVAVHLTNPVCATCHTQMDPIGLGLENFDALGRYRVTENGVTIDASGELDGDVYDGPKDLGRAIREHAEVGACLVRTMYRYANGNVESPGEAELLAHLDGRFADSRYRVLQLVMDIVMSPGFRLATPAADEGGA
jgi:hypothetical protein